MKKVLDADTGEKEEQRTAYEVSVRLIRRKRKRQKMSVEHIGKGAM